MIIIRISRRLFWWIIAFSIAGLWAIGFKLTERLISYEAGVIYLTTSSIIALVVVLMDYIRYKIFKESDTIAK